ncbi:MAG: OmpA family protein [Bacteroidota bacterium]
MRLSIFLFLSVAFPLYIHAQDTTNLVRNPSFEEFSPYTSCMRYRDMTESPIAHWKSANFFIKKFSALRLQYDGVLNRCPKATEKMKAVARQQIDGKAYVQLHMKSPIFGRAPGRGPARKLTKYYAKTYLYTELKKKLSPNKRYDLRFKIRRAFLPLEDSIEYRMDRIGFSFTHEEPIIDPKFYYRETITSFSDTLSWYPLSDPVPIDSGFLLYTDTVTFKSLNEYWAEGRIIFMSDSNYTFLSVGQIYSGVRGIYKPTKDDPYRMINSVMSYGIDDIRLTKYDPTPPKPEKVLKELALQIQFETASATLTPEAQQALEKSVSYLKTIFSETSSLKIEGHTDNVGNASANLALSRSRAEAIKAFLVERGIPESQIQTQGYGDQQPIADNTTEAGRAQNRRVELTFTTK